MPSPGLSTTGWYLEFRNTRELLEHADGQPRELERPSKKAPGEGVAGATPRRCFAPRGAQDESEEEPTGEAGPGTRPDGSFSRSSVSRSKENHPAVSATHHAGGLHRVLREVRGSAQALPHWMVGASYAQDVCVARWRAALEVDMRSPESVLRDLLKPTAVRPAREAPKRPGRSHQAWSQEDEQYLWEMVADGRSHPLEVAVTLQRSELAVVTRALTLFPRDTVRDWCGGRFDFPY
jgi:hypothetical protein